MARMRKSPNARTATPTYQGHSVTQTQASATPFMVRPRVPSQTGASLGWASPVLTPQATMRLNEAANALAAAAAAAVLEATGATPNLNDVQRAGPVESHRPRFGSNAGGGGVGNGGGGGGGNSGLGTSSEDGESISSNSFFSRNPIGKISSQEASSKAQRKKSAQDSRKGSFTNAANEIPLPILSVPTNVAPNYLQAMGPSNAGTSSTELSTFMPSTSMEDTWNHNFQPIRNPRTGEEGKFNPYSAGTQGQADVTSTFDKMPTPSAMHRPPIIKSQAPSSSGSFMTLDGNPNENTLRATDIGSMNSQSPPQDESSLTTSSPQTKNQTCTESQQ
ncbi:hypothetical protein Aperf_G00000072535 [Anoplocephala perfoliata]